MKKKTESETSADKNSKKHKQVEHLKVLEFQPRDEEQDEDFGDLLNDIINAEEDDGGNYHKISYSKKGIVLSWCEETDMMHAQVHNLTNMEINYLLQRFIINVHMDLS